MAPFDLFPQFQILSNLKGEYLVNGNFDNVIYIYGSRPNIKLTVFGVITSCPGEIDQRNILNEEFIIEKFFFVPSYPKIAVSPIGIYREVIWE